MECKISDGDIALDSCGRYIKLSSDEEVLQNAYISIAAEKGKFYYNRELGSQIRKISRDDENFSEKFLMAMKAAIVDYPDVTAIFRAKKGNKVYIRLEYRSSYLEEVIDLDGNV